MSFLTDFSELKRSFLHFKLLNCYNFNLTVSLGVYASVQQQQLSTILIYGGKKGPNSQILAP